MTEPQLSSAPPEPEAVKSSPGALDAIKEFWSEPLKRLLALLVIAATVAIAVVLLSSGGGNSYYGYRVAQAVLDAEVSHAAEEGGVVRPSNPDPVCRPAEGTSFTCTVWIAVGYAGVLIRKGFRVSVDEASCWTAAQTSDSLTGRRSLHSLGGCGLQPR